MAWVDRQGQVEESSRGMNQFLATVQTSLMLPYNLGGLQSMLDPDKEHIVLEKVSAKLESNPEEKPNMDTTLA